MVSNEIKHRKGARKAVDIPQNVLKLLNEGKISTVNLTEWLAVDQNILIRNTFPKLGLKGCIDDIIASIKQQKKDSTMNSIKVIGKVLYTYCNEHKITSSIFEILSNQESDTLRCYAIYLIALNNSLHISKKLLASKKLIADKHFGVREIAWMALRPEIEKDLNVSISLLSEWTSELDENIRRFTTESIRPRGVWCSHIEELKNTPERALVILDALKSDKSNYVQNSVGNWLNDASKSKPNFVIDLCKKWELTSPTAETKKIIKRALRSIKK